MLPANVRFHMCAEEVSVTSLPVCLSGVSALTDALFIGGCKLSL